MTHGSELINSFKVQFRSRFSGTGWPSMQDTLCDAPSTIRGNRTENSPSLSSGKRGRGKREGFP